MTNYASKGDTNKHYNEGIAVRIKLSSENDRILCDHIPKRPKLFYPHLWDTKLYIFPKFKSKISDLYKDDFTAVNTKRSLSQGHRA